MLTKDEHRVKEEALTIAAGSSDCAFFQLVLSRIFHVLWFVVFLILAAMTLGRISCQTFAVTGTLLACVGLIVAAFFLRAHIDALPGGLVIVILAFCSLLVFSVCCYTGKDMLLIPFNDTGTVYYSVAEILRDGHINDSIDNYTKCAWATHTSNNDYFLIYPHNIFLVFYLLQYFRLITAILPVSMYSDAGIFAAIVFNALSMGVAVFLCCLAARKEKGNFAALLCAGMAVLFIPFYFQAYKPYTDTFSLPYVSAALYFLLAAGKSEIKRKTTLLLVLCGISLAIGCLIKGSLLILLVAACVFLLLKSRSLKGFAAKILLLLASFTLIWSAWGSFSQTCPWIDYTDAESLEFPKMHWIMMSSVRVGGYYQEDCDFTMSFPSFEEKQEATKNEYIARVKSYGSGAEYLKFILGKLSSGLADGGYAQLDHYMRFKEREPYGQILLQGGRYYPVYYRYITLFVCVFYLFSLLTTINNIFSRRIESSALMNIIFWGLMLFFAFWEFKSRYLLSFVPVFLLLSCFGACELADRVRDLSVKFSFRRGRTVSVQ